MLTVAGNKDVKTSARLEPVAVADESRSKPTVQVRPAVHAGKEKVTRVVMSDWEVPVFWIRPWVTPKAMAPVETVYWEVLMG